MFFFVENVNIIFFSQLNISWNLYWKYEQLNQTNEFNIIYTSALLKSIVYYYESYNLHIYVPVEALLLFHSK